MLQGAGRGGNIHADFHQFLAVLAPEWNQISSVIDLLQRGFRRGIHLELKHLDRIIRHTDSIGAPDGGFHFCLNIVAQKREYQVNNCLVVFFCLVLKVIRN